MRGFATEALIQLELLNLNDSPDLVIIRVYITNAYRAYEIADNYRKRGTWSYA